MPTPTPTKTPTPVPTVSPEEFKEQLGLALGGEWEEVSFKDEVVGYRINNLEFVLPSWQVLERNFDPEHFLIKKNGGRIAPLVRLAENQVARFNEAGKIEIYQDSNLVSTLNPEISWALKPGKYVGDPLQFEGEKLMVKIKPDQGAGEKPLVEAFNPETLKTIRSSLPAVIEAHLPPGGGAIPDLEENQWWSEREQKLAREWSLFFPAEPYDEEMARWRVGEPVEPVLARIKAENFEWLWLVGFPEEKLNYLREVLSWFKIIDPRDWEYFEKIAPQFIIYRENAESGLGGYETIYLGDGVLPPSSYTFFPDAQRAYLGSLLVHEATHVAQVRRGEEMSEKEPCLNQLECLKRLKEIQVSDDSQHQATYESEIQGRIDWLDYLLLPGNYCNP